MSGERLIDGDSYPVSIWRDGTRIVGPVHAVLSVTQSPDSEGNPVRISVEVELPPELLDPVKGYALQNPGTHQWIAEIPEHGSFYVDARCGSDPDTAHFFSR
ncbi:MAG: hypothetical protein NXI11_00850 [Proteobacteria bacterium]|nr:hypothetical protein [Pseudomonadota bacterium]